MATGFPVKANYATGDVLTAANMNDLSGTVNYLQYMPPRNPVLNSNFSVWQRGTSFAVNYAYTADRWQAGRSGGTLNITVSRQATNDTTNLPNIQYCARVQRDSGVTSTNTNYFGQNFETVNSIPFTGKTVTVSFYARAGANFSSTSGTMTATLANGTGTDQNYMVGAYTGANTVVSSAVTLTTTWQRFTMTGTVPTNSTELAIQFSNIPVGTAGANDYFEVTGVQIELGSSANSYMPNQPTYQGELAACQRYYYRSVTGTANTGSTAVGVLNSTTAGRFIYPLPVQMRVAPTSVDISAQAAFDPIANSTYALTSPTLDANICSPNSAYFTATVATATSGRTVFIISTSSSGYLGFSAEL